MPPKHPSHRERFENDASDRHAFEALEEAAFVAGDWDWLVALYERRLGAAELEHSIAERTRLLHRLGRVHAERRDAPKAARACWREALRADPNCQPALAELRADALRREQWDVALQILDAELGAESNPGQRGRLLAIAGETWLDALDDPEQALTHFERALEVLPRDINILEGAARAAAARANSRIHTTQFDAPGAARSWLERATQTDRARTVPERSELEPADANDAERLAPRDPALPLQEEPADDATLLTAYRNEASVADDPERLGELVREIVRIETERGEIPDALTWAERWLAAAPEEIEAFRLTAQLHEMLEHDLELVSVLECLDPLLPRNAQADNRRRLGDVHLAHERVEPALAAYRSALEANPSDIRSHEAEISVLAEADAPEALASAYRCLAGYCEEPRRTEALDTLARLLEEKLGDLAGAADVLAQVVESAAPPPDADERLESLLERTARHEELAKHLERRASTANAGDREQLRRRRADVLLDHLGHFDAAIAAYGELLRDAPGDDAGRAGLERSLRAAGDLQALADFLDDEALRQPDLAARDLLHSERAAILADELDRGADAAQILRRLSCEAHAPEQRQHAAERLEALLERTGDLAGLRSHWEAQIESSEGPERAVLCEKLGELHLHRLGDTEGAVRHLEAAAALAPGRTELWHALAQLYERTRRPADLVRVLEATLATGVGPEEERVLASRIAAICTNTLGEPERARRHYERLIELDPTNGPAHEFLIARWQKEGRIDDIARMLERRLDALGAQPADDSEQETAQRTSLRLRIAGLRAGTLDDTDGAIAILEPGLGELGPLAAVADPLADLYRRAGYVRDLVELCESAANACEPGAERATWLKRLGDALRGRGSEHGAADAYQRALEDRPDDTCAEATLRDLYRRLGDAERLADLLTAKLSRLNGPAEIPVRIELAALHSGVLGLPDTALTHYRRVVQLDPGHTEALTRGLDLAEQLDRTELVRELLDDALTRPQPPALRARLLARRGRLLAKTPDDAADAIADFRNCLALDPSRNEVREALRELLESRKNWTAALDCRLAEASRTVGTQRIALLERGAKLAWRELSPEAALPWLERLRREAPERADVLARIAAAHAHTGRPRARLHALEAQIELTEDTRSKRDLWCARADLLERELGYPARAARDLERARALCPDDPEILHTLDRLYSTGGRDRERCSILEDLAALSRGESRIRILCEAATLSADTLGEPRRAVALMLQAVADTPQTNPRCPDLLRMLGDNLRRVGPPDAWARCAEAELASLPAVNKVFAERRQALRAELAAFYRGSGQLDTALTHLRALIDDAPHGIRPSHEHEMTLLDALRASGNRIELERRLAIQLERTGGDAVSWLELARLRDEQPSLIAGAAQAYRLARNFDPHCVTALQGLRRCAERLGLWDEVASTLDAELDAFDTCVPAQRAALFRQLGDVHWHHRGSTTQASRAYAAAIEADPEDFDALRSLQRLFESMEDWRGAANLYESEIEVLGERDPERRFAAWLRAGDIARDHTKETERALRAYRAAADIAPLPVERRRETAELHHSAGEIEAFAEVFTSWCDAPESDAGADDHLRLAETWEGLGNTVAARSRIERALALETDNARGWRMAARLHQTAGERHSAADAWRRAAETTRGPEAAESWRRAAALSTGEAALPLLRAAAAADPACRAVQSDLARAALRAEAWAEAETAASRALAASDRALLEPEIHHTMALTGARAARARGRNAPATDFFEEALGVDPNCTEALEGAGESCFALGEFERARELFERRLAHPDPSTGQHAALLARCLAETGQPDEALEHCEAALIRDPDLEDAHRLCVALHQTANRRDAGVAAILRWAERETGAERGALLRRAAEWELAENDRDADAEQHLRAATEADPEHARAWQLMAELLWRHDRKDDAGEAAAAGLRARNPEGSDRGALELLRARALEQVGNAEAAAAAFGQAAATDPADFEAADSRARLLRAAGDWRGAAETLERFTRHYAGADPAPLVDALEQVARLLAGPLENASGAVQAYRRAVELAPGRSELRVSLGKLLSERPETLWEALDQYAATLELDPVHPGALRATHQIARTRDDIACINAGRALMAAIGIAEPSEPSDGNEHFGFPLAPVSVLDEALGEALRRAVQQVSGEIGSALRAPSELVKCDATADPAARFRAMALAVQADLTAPGLLPLPTQGVGDVVRCIATLALAPDSVRVSGATINALAGTIGRRARRRLRRTLAETSLSSIENFDFTCWRQELRALAAARAVDRLGGDLRSALVALVSDASDHSPAEIDTTGDFGSQVAACPEARALVARGVRSWIARLRAGEHSSRGTAR